MVLTRSLIEHQLDAFQRRLPNGSWTRYTVLGGAVLVGMLLSRVPLLTFVTVSARTVSTVLSAACTVVAAERFLTTPAAGRADMRGRTPPLPVRDVGVR